MKKSNVTKITSMLLALVLMMSALAGCSSGSTTTTPAPAPAETTAPSQDPAPAEDAGSLVLYASTPEDFLNVIVQDFEATTGIKVEVVAAGTGELYKRIEAEGDNPLGDVMLGGMVSSGYIPNIDLWEEYVSPNDKDLPERYQSATGKVTSFNLVPSVIMLNNELTSQYEINGYEDLLNPDLKGTIVMPDPSQTSSGWEQLVNMLYAMGGGDTDEGWAYVDKLLANIDGKLLQGSSATHKGVADGEYAVGLVAEGMVDVYLEEGVGVAKVFMEEGVVVNVDGVAIIKGAQNKENAEKFIDFLISKEFQSKMATLSPPRRPIRDDIDSKSTLTPTTEINVVSIDEDYVGSNKTQMLEHFKELSINYG